MSEFSESFQAYHPDRAPVVALLRTLGVGGWILASNARCVSFILDDPEREADVLAASRGVLARYYYGEDHGLWVRFYLDGEQLTAIALVWDSDAGGVQEEQEEVEPAARIVAKLAHAGVLGEAEATELRRVLEAFSPEDPGSREHAVEAIPRLLGFPASTWLSAAYVQETEPEDLRELFPGAEVVEVG